MVLIQLAMETSQVYIYLCKDMICVQSLEAKTQPFSQMLIISFITVSVAVKTQKDKTVFTSLRIPKLITLSVSLVSVFAERTKPPGVGWLPAKVSLSKFL